MVNNNRLDAIWHQLARSTRYARYVDKKDLSTFSRRYTAEGLAFAARELGKLRSVFLASLERGSWDSDGLMPVRFGRKRESILPRFLYLAFSSVFTDEGLLRYDYDVGAIDCVNCLTAVFTKIEGGHTPASEVAVINNFVQTERELALYATVGWQQAMEGGSVFYNTVTNTYPSNGTYEYEVLRSSVKFSRVMEEAALIVRSVLARSNPRNITPRSGSGASACGLPVHARFGSPRLVPKIDRIWHYEDFWSPGKSHLNSERQPWAEELDVPQAKVLLVPKDCRGPRLISCEPRETMWVQQGLMERLVRTMESHHLTKGKVNFSDQTVNRHLSCRASVKTTLELLLQKQKVGPHECSDIYWSKYRALKGLGRESELHGLNMCTLDLKDASDRVTMTLVKYLFPGNWAEALDACRSPETVLPTGATVRMHKHAPMGSAVCFPVMALCIWSIAEAVIRLTGYRVNNLYRSKYGFGQYEEWEKVETQAFVYGDDIVAPGPLSGAITGALELAGLLVNQNKSYTHGPYRESCGGEYVLGMDVTPIRLRCMPEDDAVTKLKTIAFVNNCSQKFSDLETQGLRDLVRSWYGAIPEMDASFNSSEVSVDPRSMTGVFNVSDTRPDNRAVRSRWNSRLQRREYRILCCISEDTKYPTDNWSCLLRALVQPRLQALGTDALPKRVRTKYRWVHLGG